VGSHVPRSTIHDLPQGRTGLGVGKAEDQEREVVGVTVAASGRRVWKDKCSGRGGLRRFRQADATHEVGEPATQRLQERREQKAPPLRLEAEAVDKFRFDEIEYLGPRWRIFPCSVADLVLTLKELNELGVGFVSLTEALDLATPTGRAMAGLLAVFAEFEREILRERARAGIAQARKQGRPHGRPPSALRKETEIRELFADGFSKSAIARQLGSGRTSVRRILM